MKIGKIGIDVEGVLADPHTPWVNDYNSLYGTDLKVDDITDWYFNGTRFKVTSDDFIRQNTELWRERWKDIPTTEADLSRRLQELNERYEVLIITSRKANEGEIRDWLKFHGIRYSEFVALDYNPSSSGKTSIDCDVYVDDSPLLATEIALKRGRLLIYDRPWNQDVKENEYVERVGNFEEVLEVLAALDKG